MSCWQTRLPARRRTSVSARTDPGHSPTHHWTWSCDRVYWWCRARWCQSCKAGEVRNARPQLVPRSLQTRMRKRVAETGLAHPLGRRHDTTWPAKRAAQAARPCPTRDYRRPAQLWPTTNQQSAPSRTWWCDWSRLVDQLFQGAHSNHAWTSLDSRCGWQSPRPGCATSPVAPRCRPCGPRRCQRRQSRSQTWQWSCWASFAW